MCFQSPFPKISPQICQLNALCRPKILLVVQNNRRTHSIFPTGQRSVVPKFRIIAGMQRGKKCARRGTRRGCIWCIWCVDALLLSEALAGTDRSAELREWRRQRLQVEPHELIDLPSPCTLRWRRAQGDTTSPGRTAASPLVGISCCRWRALRSTTPLTRPCST